MQNEGRRYLQTIVNIEEILTTDAAGESIKIVEAHRGSSETLQRAQRSQGVHGSTSTGTCC